MLDRHGRRGFLTKAYSECSFFVRSLGHVRSHLFKFLHGGLRQNPNLREQMLEATDFAAFTQIVDALEVESWAQPRFQTPEFDPTLSWYWRHRPEGVAAPAAADAADAGLGAGDGTEGDPAPISRDEIAAAAMARRARKKVARERRHVQRRGGRGRGGRQGESEGASDAAPAAAAAA